MGTVVCAARRIAEALARGGAPVAVGTRGERTQRTARTKDGTGGLGRVVALMRMSGAWDGDGAQGGAEVDEGRMAAWTWAPQRGRLAKASPDHGPTWIGCVGGGTTAAGMWRTNTDGHGRTRTPKAAGAPHPTLPGRGYNHDLKA